MASKKRRKASRRSEKVKKEFETKSSKVSIARKTLSKRSKSGESCTTTTTRVRRKPTPAELTNKKIAKKKAKK